jgi:hypothetical protein
VQLFADEISTDNLSLCDDENGLLVLDHLFEQELLNVDDEMLGNESSFDDSDTYLDEFISGVSDDSSSDGDIYDKYLPCILEIRPQIVLPS